VIAATEVPDSCSDESSRTIEFTHADISDILDGERVTRGGYTFSLVEVDTDFVNCIASLETWEKLYNGDKKNIMWSNDVTGVLADPDDTELSHNIELSTIDDSDKQHVTMEVTVDVADMDDDSRAVIATLARQYEEAFQTIVEKNRDYGFSFLTSAKALTESTGSPFDSVTRAQAYGLLTRIGDKRQRLMNNVYGDGSAEVSDPPEITAQEAATYYQFLAMVLANPELAEDVADA